MHSYMCMGGFDNTFMWNCIGFKLHARVRTVCIFQNQPCGTTNSLKCDIHIIIIMCSTMYVIMILCFSPSLPTSPPPPPPPSFPPYLPTSLPPFLPPSLFPSFSLTLSYLSSTVRVCLTCQVVPVQCNHAMLLIGYGYTYVDNLQTDYWLLKNR